MILATLGSQILFLLVLGIGLWVYFIPYDIASKRKRTDKTAILMLNLFLGWTLVGWVAALVWALGRDAGADQQRLATQNAELLAELKKQTRP